MTRIKLISAAVIMSAAIATPAFAQEFYGTYVGGPYGPGPVYYGYRGYDVPPGSYPPRDSDEFWNEVNHGFSGRDPSRTGGVSPNLKPPGS
ncbi:MAG TPA: hypothetical protein VFL62_18650 [Bradyrhizobium sp.]|uniref:hypothetical protein n=1 Tax=Bradyrhizobium sp. TaxID=376 RepID=UPI002D7FB46F|nr:hypothetical protein [Bradyrhizobium sp.]HET7888247.1 hypothetical protein [Bradyrhizobium sp.]